METDQECVESIIIDVCTRSFLLFSDQGNELSLECDNAREFMNVIQVVTSQLKPEQIRYSNISVCN